MAKKKSTTTATATLTSIQKDLPNEVRPDITKFNNLRALNQLLLKETMEKRSEADSLKSQIEAMKERQSFMSKIEHEVCRIVIGTAMAEKSKVDSGWVEKLGSMEKGRDFVKNVLEGMVKELEMDSMAIKDELGHCIVEGDVTDRMWKKEEEASNSFEELMEGREKEEGEVGMKFEETASQMEQKVNGYVMKIKKSEKESFEVNNAIRRLEGEFGALRGENERLRVKVAELEMKGRDATEEINKIRVNIVEVEKEKEEMRSEFENKFRNLEKGYKEKNEKAKKELDSLKKEKNNQEMKHKSKVSELYRRFDEKIGEAQNEVARLRENTVALEKENEEAQKKFEADTRELGSRLVESNRKLRNFMRESNRMEKVSREQAIEIVELKKTVETLNSRILMFEEKQMEFNENTSLLDEMDAVKMKNNLLQQEMLYVKEEYESKVKDLRTKLEESQLKINTISKEEEDTKKEREESDKENVKLRKEVENVSANLSKLERKHSKLQNENDAVKNELSAERKASEELKRKNDESAKEIKQLYASLNELSSEKDAARKHIESLEKKMKAAEMNREVVMLKEAVKEAKTKNPKPGPALWTSDRSNRLGHPKKWGTIIHLKEMAICKSGKSINGETKFPNREIDYKQRRSKSCSPNRKS